MREKTREKVELASAILKPLRIDITVIVYPEEAAIRNTYKQQQPRWASSPAPPSGRHRRRPEGPSR